LGIVRDLAIDRLADRLARLTERGIATVVERRGPAIARTAERLQREHPHRTPSQLARVAIARSSRLLAGTGAASALPATLPGAGTVTEIGAALGDSSLLTATHAELVLTIAYLYGRPLDDVAGRRLDVLMAMGVEAGVVDLHRNGTIKVMGRVYADRELRGPAGRELAARLNRRLAGQVVGRLARRRAHVIIGREVPLLGISVAAGYNLWSTRKVGNAARAYFQHISSR
jgi:uncharacterized protein (DUF697 family)